MTTNESVVIVGAGQAGVQLADSLRAAGHRGPLTLVGDEPWLPYQRPPLSKDHLAHLPQGAPAASPLRSAAFYAAQDIDLRTGVRVSGVDRTARQVHLDAGSPVSYTTLVLATGATKRQLRLAGHDLAGVHGLRTYPEAEAFRQELGAATSLVVIGAGFIGLEAAATARARGLAVTVLEPTERPMGRAVSPQVSTHVARVHRRMGTDLRLGEGAAGFVGSGGRVTGVLSTSGHEHRADVVLVGIGAVPRDELARDAGLAVDDGVLVDAELRTSDPRVYAIGDCVRFPSSHLGALLRLESVQNATDQARHLATTILGGREPYTTVPWFWSNQGPLRLQIAGLVGPDDDRVVAGDVEGDRFSVYSFSGGRLRAVESIGSAPDHLAARRLLTQGRSPTPEQVLAPGFSLKLFAREVAEPASALTTAR